MICMIKELLQKFHIIYSKNRLLTIAVGGIIVMWGVNLFVGLFWDLEKAGPFGDQFGAVNALFSGLAFLGLIYTIIQQTQSIELQRDDLKNQLEELKLNREELELTRGEMEQQTAEFEKQNQTLKLQRFEDTFFHMLELQQQIVNDLQYEVEEKVTLIEYGPDGKTSKEALNKKVITGRELFRYSFDEAIHYSKNEILGEKDEVSGFRGYLRYNGFLSYGLSYTPTFFDHYFRHLYSILKFIDKTDVLDEKGKYQYATFLRSTLSRYELVWLFYNGLSKYGCEKLKPLLEKYSMLKNLRPDFLALSKEHLDYLNGLKISNADFQHANLVVSDYYLFISDIPDDKTKYYLSAFYSQDNLESGIRLIEKWKNFLAGFSN